MAWADGLASSPGLAVLAVLLLGLCVGSFLNVVVWRLPKMLERDWRRECQALLDLPPGATSESWSLLRPRSSCPACRHPIRPWHNLPVVGWLWLRGRCADCGAAISVRYPIVEALAAILGLACWMQFGPTTELVAALAVTWTLLALALIDVDTQLLPDVLTLPLLWAGLLWNLGGGFASPADAIIGAAAGYLSLWSVYHVFRLATGKEGMGYGDFKLLAALGAWLGWQALPLTILLSSAVGAAVGLGLITMRGHDRQVPIPFGPYLATAGWIMLLWGHPLNAWWWRTTGAG